MNHRNSVAASSRGQSSGNILVRSVAIVNNYCKLIRALERREVVDGKRWCKTDREELQRRNFITWWLYCRGSVDRKGRGSSRWTEVDRWAGWQS